MSAVAPIYTHTRYAEMVNTTIQEIARLGRVKGGEYAGDEDRLANFRRNGERLGIPMETVWSVYFAKHEDAVMQYVKDLNAGKTRERSEPISGRIDDMLVYLILLKCIIDERENGAGN